MPTPQVAPSPFGRSREYAALNQGLLQNLAANAATVGKAQAADQEQKTKIATTMLSNADDLASVFGGTQTGAGLENYLNLPNLRGLGNTGYQGGMTGQLDALRLATMAARARGGSGGGGGKTLGAEGTLMQYADGSYHVIDPKDAMADIRNGAQQVDWAALPDDAVVSLHKKGIAATGRELKHRNIIGYEQIATPTSPVNPYKDYPESVDDNGVTYNIIDKNTAWNQNTNQLETRPE